jgi:hypothetical protein
MMRGSMNVKFMVFYDHFPPKNYFDTGHFAVKCELSTGK